MRGIPGSNLLSAALRLVHPQGVTLKPWVSRAENDAGNDVDRFGPTFAVSGSVQPMAKTTQQLLGLDMSKTYVNFFTRHPVKVLERDRSADRIVWNGSEYLCESSTDWTAQDGWSEVLCVRISK